MVICAVMLTSAGPLAAQQASVSLHVGFVGADSKAHAPISAETPVVVWLTPLDRAAEPLRAASSFHMVQKNKEFVPHLLVVPVGSTIDFPNADPFFHNVFSLFNGRRFDLGLYQSGRSRATRFDREGVSYIFCNIHPEMGGIVVSLATPYFATSASGAVTLNHVPPGSYMLHAWSERATPESVREAERKVTVGTADAEVGQVLLREQLGVKPHKNMFGEDYPAQP